MLGLDAALFVAGMFVGAALLTLLKRNEDRKASVAAQARMRRQRSET